ncbi:Beta-ketoacyl synthase protein [Ancylostoma ceylanicum]|uniref:Fatty acid synthase n=1 Tax=Ancylostoma ceylanicum TaxID=53326 RepID=A0A0D6LKJ0_9BILA|nr:Beta-ketoacyl synthase protein [Ancylostoma ceylanicum]
MSSNDQPWWKEQEEIVISGVSGRFPRCENVNEFGDLLLQGEDLITEDDLRWPPGFYDLPKRHGKLKDLKKFDAQFFSVTPKQANFMDPQVRILLEVAWEAMVDAGINPVDLRGSRTGVFVGCSASETSGALTQDPETVTGYTLTGCVRSMFSNRISYTFDLQGPSFSVDTACSSSLLALQLAIDAIRQVALLSLYLVVVLLHAVLFQKQCDAAIVAGAHLTLTPTAALQFLRLGMLTEKGSCRSFDDSGDGYCRTEGVAAIFIQRKSKANRIYATVLHAKSNTDGYKEQGITFPSGERQAQLLEEVYNEAGVDPNSVYYVETHGTGTKVGDPQEANAICQVFCSNRKEPLLIGSVKSNMGHAEPASGLCSIAKVLVAIERKMIPPNLHFNTPNQYIPGLTDGRLKVVTEPTPLPGGVIGVNSFGFGGSNTHVILKAADHAAPPLTEVPFTKILTYCGRTQDAVQHVFSVVENNINDGYLQALLANQANLPAKDTPFRGYMLINRGGDQPPLKDVQKVKTFLPLMTLEEFGLDVYGMLCNSDPAQYQNNTLNCMLAITAIQIALTDLLFSLGVTPDGIIGHSTGEMGCGYADGGITREQTMRLAYHRGTTMMKHKEIKGGMAAVGLTWEEAQAQCPEGVVAACHNGADSVTISGDGEKVLQFCEQLKEKGIFAKKIPPNAVTIEMAPHSLMQAILRRSLQKTVSNIGLMNKPKTENENELETFLQSLGKIYQAGVNIRVEDLYPGGRFKGVVPRGTPMIGPMWKWDHSQDWPVIDGRHMAAAGGGGLAVSASYHIDPFAADSKPPFSLNQVQAPFLTTLVKQCTLLRYLSAISVKLDCVVTPGNGMFEILSEEQVAASGRIYIPEEDQPFYYGKLSDIRTSEIADRIELDTEDAYKEFLLRGYEYGQAFRGIYKTCNSGERGYLYWTGNWVTFLDSLLQTALLAERADTLRLPTRVRHLRIDPVKHLEHLIEKDGIQLYHERIYFVPHYDDECLKVVPKDREFLTQYGTALKFVVARGLETWNKLGLLKKMTNGTLLKNALDALRPYGKNEVTEGTLRTFLDDSRCPILHALHDVFALNYADGMTASQFEEAVTSKLKQVRAVFDCDRLWAAALLEDRVIKTIQVECLCVGPNVDQLDDNSLEQIGARKVRLNIDENFTGHNDAKNMDYLVVDKVLCRKENPASYLNACKHLLRDDGFMIVIEVTSDYELANVIQGLFGQELYVSKERRFGTYFTHEELLKLFKDTGFKLCNYQRDPALMTSSYIIRKSPSVPRDPVFIDVDDVKEFTWIEPLQKVIEERLNEPDSKTIWLTNTKVRNNGVVGLALCFVEENLKSNRFRSIIDMSLNRKRREGPPEITLDDPKIKEIIDLDLHANNYKDGIWGSLRHFVVKDEDAHTFKDCQHAFINTLTRGDVSSLTWFESPNQYFDAIEGKKDTHEICSVYYSAINFRDVMLAYGRLPPDAIPGNFADRECLLGMEFSGKLKDGTRLMGILPAQGERVLIHGGAGGVGQAAIAIALSYGCEVFTTVGSQDKREYLKKKFPQLQDVHFANSRSADFELHIRQYTKDEWKEVAALLESGIKSGVVQPLPASLFPSDKAEDAFRFMSAGRHIGKVVMEIRKEEPDRACPPSPISVRAICRTLCHPQHVYLITGGLGGFGLELAQWLINRGARKLVLTSRSGIRTGYQARCVHFWRRTGISVLISTLNIAKRSDADELVRQCLSMGRLGGVFHLAMVLRDCLFENQNVQNFKDAAEAKYYGTINLDYATRAQCDEALRWFVVFSSITSGRGNAGQTNYGWSNSTMERMIEQRREDGYPGIAIQWGAIGDVGVILENMGDNNTVVGGTLPQRMPSCLASLDMFLSWNHPIVSSYIKADMGQKKAAGGGNLLQTIAHILGVNDVSQLNPDANLGDLGLDSLMGVEIKQALERDYDIVLSMKDIRTLTLNKLQQLAESGGQGATALQTTELDMKLETERDAEQNTVEMLEKQMNQLFKMRVDVNDLDPQDVVVKCNKVEEGPVTFFVHSIEGIATPLKRVMTKCNFPVYCFQSTKEVPQDSIESVAKCYIKEMKKIQPEGPYRIVGYSYGACIGFEMATMLQESDGPSAVERLILLDGSHLYMQTYRNVYRMAFGVTGDTLVNNPLFESEIMCAMTLRFANVDYKKFRVELLQQPGFKARIQKVVDTVMTTGLFKSPETIAFACEAMRSKFLMADKCVFRRVSLWVV